MAEVVGDVGFQVEYGDLEGTIKAFEIALRSDMHQKARSRIIEEFPLRRREELMVANVRELLNMDR